MKKLLILFIINCSLFIAPARANTFVDVESFEAEVSMFQKIADLEQEKVLMQLEKERAQLQLDLDRMAAEQARLVREQNSADARAEEQLAEIEKQKLAIEQERQKLEEQRRKMAEEAARIAVEKENAAPVRPAKNEKEESAQALADKYYLLEIVGAGNQLVATVEHMGSGKQRRVSVGKSLDGYMVRSISIDDGVEFERNGEVIIIGIGSRGAGE